MMANVCRNVEYLIFLKLLYSYRFQYVVINTIKYVTVRKMKFLKCLFFLSDSMLFHAL